MTQANNNEERHLNAETKIHIINYVDYLFSKKTKRIISILGIVAAIGGFSLYTSINTFSKSTAERYIEEQMKDYVKRIDSLEQNVKTRIQYLETKRDEAIEIVYQSRIQAEAASTYAAEQVKNLKGKVENMEHELESANEMLMTNSQEFSKSVEELKTKVENSKNETESACRKFTEDIQNLRVKVEKLENEIEDAEKVVLAVNKVASAKDEIIHQLANNDGFIRTLQSTINKRMHALPVGAVIPFLGTERELMRLTESGWAICNGQNGTPDLRSRFLYGVGDTHAAGKSGGRRDHSHAGTTTSPSGNRRHTGMGGSRGASDDHTHNVNIESSEHLPPYVTVVFIKRIR